MKLLRLTILFSTLVLLSGCGSHIIALKKDWQMPPPSHGQNALIYGYLAEGDSTQSLAPADITISKRNTVKVHLGRVGEKVYIFSDGRFVAPVKAGEYSLSNMVVWDRNYMLSQAQPDYGYKPASAGKANYFGSYYVSIKSKSGFLKNGTFTMTKASYPNKKDLDSWLHKITKGTSWEKMIN